MWMYISMYDCQGFFVNGEICAGNNVGGYCCPTYHGSSEKQSGLIGKIVLRCSSSKVIIDVVAITQVQWHTVRVAHS